jgi:hypothetical protein
VSKLSKRDKRILKWIAAGGFSDRILTLQRRGAKAQLCHADVLPAAPGRIGASVEMPTELAPEAQTVEHSKISRPCKR